MSFAFNVGEIVTILKSLNLSLSLYTKRLIDSKQISNPGTTKKINDEMDMIRVIISKIKRVAKKKNKMVIIEKFLELKIV